MEFKDIIQQRRKALGLTLEEVGKAVGVGKATVQRWESGNINNPRRDKIAKLAQVLGISPTELVDAVDMSPQTAVPSAAEMRLLYAYRQADPTYQAVALELLESHPAQSAKVARA